MKSNLLAALRKRVRRPTSSRRRSLGFDGLETRQLLAADVLNWHYDLAGTGVNPNETTLSPANVNASLFGKLFTTPLDGSKVYAQPLSKSGVNITTGPNAGVHNVVYVATMNDSVYAIDADSGALLWQDAFANPAAGITPISEADLGIKPGDGPFGILSTPVIDPVGGNIFVLTMSKEVVNGTAHYVH